MAASSDDTARGIKIFQRTDPLQLQEGMYRPMQVHQGCTHVHCIMCLFGRLLGAIRHLDIYNIIIIIIILIIMYIYHALINALGAHMIHINLNIIFYTHVEHSPEVDRRQVCG